jgi:hypothetical protein
VNSPASIRARLLNVSKQSGEDFQAMLTRYAIERLLYRLGTSQHRDSFVLKGAMLFIAWQGNLHRPTKDLDLLGFGSASLEDVAWRMREIAGMPGDDGIIFDANSVVTEVIKEDAEYEGVRAKLVATLEQARIGMQIDIGFGDAVQPEPRTSQFPTVLKQLDAPTADVPARGRHFGEVARNGRFRYPEQPNEGLLRPVVLGENAILRANATSRIAAGYIRTARHPSA